MMNKTTYLLLKIAEEAAEVSQMAAKTAQFGTDDCYQGGPSNLERLSGELKQLTTVCALLAKRQNDVAGEAFGFGETVVIAQWDSDKTDRVDRYFRQAVLNPDLIRATDDRVASEKPGPFDPRAWAAENLDAWAPETSGTVGDIRWWCDSDAGSDFFDIKHNGDVYRVPLSDWTTTRCALIRAVGPLGLRDFRPA